MIEGSIVLNIIVELLPDVNTILSAPSKHHFYLPHVYSSKHYVYIMLGKQHVDYNRKMIKWQERIHIGNFMKTNHETKPRVRIRVKLKPVH